MRLRSVAAELEESYGVRAHVITRDLSQPASVSELYRELRQRSIPVDILVNNAGFASGGTFAESDPANATQLLQLNVMALTHLTRCFFQR